MSEHVTLSNGAEVYKAGDGVYWMRERIDAPLSTGVTITHRRTAIGRFASIEEAAQVMQGRIKRYEAACKGL